MGLSSYHSHLPAGLSQAWPQSAEAQREGSACRYLPRCRPACSFGEFDTHMPMVGVVFDRLLCSAGASGLAAYRKKRFAAGLLNLPKLELLIPSVSASADVLHAVC